MQQCCIFTILLQNWEIGPYSLVIQLEERVSQDKFSEMRSNLHHSVAGPLLPLTPSYTTHTSMCRSSSGLKGPHSFALISLVGVLEQLPLKGPHSLCSHATSLQATSRSPLGRQRSCAEAVFPHPLMPQEPRCYSPSTSPASKCQACSSREGHRTTRNTATPPPGPNGLAPGATGPTPEQQSGEPRVQHLYHV